MEVTKRSDVLKRNCPEKIPIVHHILSDEAAGLPKAMRQMNLSRATKLLTDGHSIHLIDRHVNALNRIAKKYCNGYLMKDLVQVFKIIDICADRLEQNADYVQPLCALLQICKMPFLKEKMSDEVAYQQIVVESLSQLGYLMRVPHQEVRSVLIGVLMAIFTEPTKVDQHLLKDLHGVSLDFNRKMVEMSDLSETLVNSLSFMDNRSPNKVKVLKLIKKFSSSPANCRQMLSVEAAAAYRICMDMSCEEDFGPHGLVLFESVEILWNLLEHGRREAAAQLANPQCCKIIKNKFRRLMVECSSNYQRQLRNDLLVITTLIAEHPKSPIVETGFAKDLILFSTFTEIKSHNPLVKNLQLTHCHEDFELKKLLINFICVLSRDPAARMLYSEGKVVLSLFNFVRGNKTNEGGDVTSASMTPSSSSSSKWTACQFEELQLQAIATLSTLVPLMIDQYISCQGNIRLLLLLEWCTAKRDDYGGEGNSFHGRGSRGTKKAQLKYCVRLLRAAVFTNNFDVIQDLCDQGVLAQLLDILERFPDTNELIEIEVQCDMLHVLSVLCESDMHKKELFGMHGVEVLVAYMRRYMRKLSSGLGHHLIMLATVDAISSCIVGCFQTEDIFLEREGVFLLLDLLETSARAMHNIVLTCLLELCENHKCLHHLHTWRGADGKTTCGHLMARLWRGEEELLRVERDRSSGTIRDLNHPISGFLQRNQPVLPQPSTSPSPAIVDVSENLRSKIYALFVRMGFSDLPGLTTKDYVTLAVIEKYLELKLGEVWGEIGSELAREGVELTSTDEEALATVERATAERTRGVAILQRELLHAERNQSLIDENNTYLHLKEVNDQFEKARVRMEEKLARTSDHAKLVESKRAQMKSIEASRSKKQRVRHHQINISSTKRQTQHHELIMDKLNITTFAGRHVSVKRDKNEVVKQ